MSTETLLKKKINDTSGMHNLRIEASKVNIRDLLLKVRYKEKQEKKENYVFLGLICGVVAVTGIIATF